MDEVMSRDQVLSILEDANPSRPDLVAMYADQFGSYQEAQANIERVGNVCADPKTGKPIPNPYLVIRDNSRKAMLAMPKVKATALWAIVSAGATPSPHREDSP